MDNNWHVVKEDDRYIVLDNRSLSKLVPSITKLNPKKAHLVINMRAKKKFMFFTKEQE
jgi:hypothetical protein